MISETAGETRVAAGELLALTTAIFGRVGMVTEDGATLADALADVDLGGVHSHGVLRVPEYVARSTRGGVDPRGCPAITQNGGACLAMDVGDSLGQIGVRFAMVRQGATAPA